MDNNNTNTPPVQSSDTEQPANPGTVPYLTKQPQFPRNTFSHNMKIILAGICVLIAAGVTIIFALQAQKSTFSPRLSLAPPATPTPTPFIIPGKPIREGNIALLEGNIVSLINTNTMMKTKLPLPKLSGPQNIAFSHDGNTLFVGDNGLFVIYNMKTKRFITPPNLDPNPRVDTIDDVAPNDKYFVLTQSCCPGDVSKAIMDFDGKFLFQQLGRNTAWSPDSTLLAINRGDVPINLPLGPQPSNTSIYIDSVSVGTVSAKLLIKATNQASYAPIKWIDNQTLMYKKELYSKPFPSNLDPNNQKESDYWMNVLDHPTISYHTMNIKTRIIHDAQYTPPPFGELPSADGKWEIVVEGQGSIFGPTYVVNVATKEKIKISSNGLAVWEPLGR